MYIFNNPSRAVLPAFLVLVQLLACMADVSARNKNGTLVKKSGA